MISYSLQGIRIRGYLCEPGCGMECDSGRKTGFNGGKLHKKGQKAGIYDAPFAFFGENTEEEIPALPDMFMKKYC